MQFEWIIIDGYNALHSQPSLSLLLKSDPQKARDLFLNLIKEYLYKNSQKTTIIFDGISEEKDLFNSTNKIEVLFSSSKLSADGLIERLVNKHQNPEKICVITSDQLEQQIVSSSGAYVESSEIFMQKCKNSKNTTYSTNMKASQKPKLGDFFPNDLK